MLESSAAVEVEARNPRAPELNAEAPGPHILEIETVDPVLKMYAPRTMVELRGTKQTYGGGLISVEVLVYRRTNMA